MTNRSEPSGDTDANQELSLQNRLITALIAPIIFNVSIAIIWLLIIKRFRSPYTGSKSSAALSFISFPMLLMVAIPAIAGFMMGTSRFATLMGHFFYSNLEHEKDLRITAALWAAMLLLSCLWAR